MKDDPKGRAILFFGFYFVFFTAVIIFLRSSDGKVSSYDSNVVDENPLAFEVDSFEKNYHFHYTVTVDSDSYLYDGIRNGSREQFSFQNKKYYYDGSTYFVYRDAWVKDENPYLYSEFLNFDNIVELLRKSYFESETTYKSGKITYHFSLDTNVIYQTLFLKDTDFDGKENSIVVRINEDKNVESVVFDLENYCVSLDNCKDNLKISLEYDQMGEILEIKNPLEEK